MAKFKAFKETGTEKWVVKTREEYKGAKWTCAGYSRKGSAEAKVAWKANLEKKIVGIDGKAAVKEERVKLKQAMTEWFDSYMRSKTTRGAPEARERYRPMKILWVRFYKGLLLF